MSGVRKTGDTPNVINLADVPRPAKKEGTFESLLSGATAVFGDLRGKDRYAPVDRGWGAMLQSGPAKIGSAAIGGDFKTTSLQTAAQRVNDTRTVAELKLARLNHLGAQLELCEAQLKSFEEGNV